MIETKKREISGREWSVVQFSGSKNLDVAHAIFKVLGPGLARALAGGGVAGLMDRQIDLGGAVDGILQNLSTIGELRQFVDKLLANTFVNGRPMSGAEFDEVFAGPAIMDLPAVIKFVIEANFGDFSTAATGTIAPSAAARETQEA